MSGRRLLSSLLSHRGAVVWRSVGYDERSLPAELGESFALVKAVREAHHTPWEVEQRFAFASFRMLAPAPA